MTVAIHVHLGRDHVADALELQQLDLPLQGAQRGHDLACMGAMDMRTLEKLVATSVKHARASELATRRS